MGDEENRMPKNARREKNSKKESEREREREKKKRNRKRKRERERAARERTAIQYGETRRTVALYQKVPATYIYIYILILMHYFPLHTLPVHLKGVAGEISSRGCSW